MQLLQFNELSPAAQEKAREWYRKDNDGLPDEWYDSDYDDFQIICRILGITLDTYTVQLHGGGTRQKPAIWHSGFCAQGDGACFAGRYSGRAEAREEIRDHAPQDVVLHTIADVLHIDFVEPYEDLTAHVLITQEGRYCHSGTLSVNSGLYQESDGEEKEIPWDRLKLYEGQLRRLADWLWNQLRETYFAMTSDEAIDEAIQGNEYWFLSNGSYFPSIETED